MNENGEELNNYNELLKQLGEIIKESKTALNKEIGTFDEADISAMLDEVKQLSSFVSDNL